MVVLKDFEEVLTRARAVVPRWSAVVAGADDPHVIEAMVSVRKEAIAEPILIGKARVIERLLKTVGERPVDYRIVDCVDVRDACAKAAQIAGREKNAYLVKGMVETHDLLKQVTNEDNGLHMGRLMSHVAVNSLPGYPKLIVNTDGGMVPYPTLEEKKSILQNAVATLRKLGYTRPKVAVLCAVEKVNPKLPETVDAEALKRMSLSGEIWDCIVEGPISYDIAMSQESAALKRFDCPHCGDFDILLVPNMVAGNILGKCWSVTCGATMAGVVVGSKVPVALTSRMAPPREKFLSIALAAAVSAGSVEEP